MVFVSRSVGPFHILRKKYVFFSTPPPLEHLRAQVETAGLAERLFPTHGVGH